MKRLVCLTVLTMIIIIGLVVVIGCKETTQEVPAVPEAQETEVSSGLPENPSGETSSPSTVIIELEIEGFAFSQKTVSLPVGTTVTWKNLDSVSHTVTARGTAFDSGGLSRDETFSYTFTETGTFEYYCAIHPYMTGEVLVE